MPDNTLSEKAFQAASPAYYVWPMYDPLRCGYALSEGLCFYLGIGVSVDYVKAFNCFWNAYLMQGGKASYCIGVCYITGRGTACDAKLAIYLWEALFDDALAVFALGVCYARGWGVTANVETALQYLHRAAKLDFPRAADEIVALQQSYSGENIYAYSQNNVRSVGNNAYSTSGMTTNNAVVLTNYTMKSAANKVQNAVNCVESNICTSLPVRYVPARTAVSDEAVVVNRSESASNNTLADYYTGNPTFMQQLQAAHANNPKSQFLVGLDYKHGQNVAVSPEHAAYWFAKAAEQNHAEAMVELALCYFHGFGVIMSHYQASRLLQHAMELGSTTAANYFKLLKFAANERELGQETALAHAYNAYFNPSYQQVFRYATEYQTHTLDYSTKVRENNKDRVNTVEPNVNATSDAEALFYQAENCIKGIGVVVDEQKAVEYFRMSANLGYMHAYCRLAQCYSCGSGIAQDKALAFYWYQKAAMYGHPEAYNSLGYFYEHGIATPVDLYKACEYYKNAVAAGHGSAYTRLIFCQQKLQQTTQNTQKEPISTYSKPGNEFVETPTVVRAASPKNPPTYCLDVVSVYFLDDIDPNMPVQNRTLIESASDWRSCVVFDESYQANNRYNKAFIDAKSFVPPAVTAILSYARPTLEILEYSAYYGDESAYYRLAVHYRDGDGCKQYFDYAFRLFYVSAAKNHVDAMNNLAACYETGRGCDRNYQKAFYLYIQTAQTGSAVGQYNVGRCYAEGIGVPQNDVQAFYWIFRAASSNQTKAIEYLARMYENGIGVAPNVANAAKWRERLRSVLV